MHIVKRILGFIIFFAILAIFTGVIAAADWNVSAGDSIQTVINIASANDTITVNDNNGTAYTYTENVVINKKINLQASSSLVTVKALNANNPVFTITSTGTGTTIQGFIINGGSYGINVNAANCKISGNTIYNNKQQGIYINGANATIVGNNVTGNSKDGIWVKGANPIISRNTATSNGLSGVNVNGNDSIITPDNIIHDNTRTGLYIRGNNINLSGLNIYNNEGYGIDIAGVNITITNNTITNNGNAGIVVNSANVTVTENNVTNNANNRLSGWIYNGIDITGINAIVVGNTVTGNARTGINVANGNNALILQNILFSNGGYGINAAGLNLTISENNATNNGNAGIVANGANATITNNNATNNGNNRFSGWVYNGIHITGNNAIITNDNIIHHNARTGLYVRGNNINLSGLNIYNNGGYGIDIAGLNITVTNNTLTNNGNAGIVVNGENATIIENNVTNNGKSGFSGWSWNGIDVTGKNAIIIGNIVTSNSRNGINVANGNYAQILKNVLLSNGGYGINAAGLNLTISENNVTNNGNAGIVANGANATITNNNATNNGINRFSGWVYNGIRITGDNAIIKGNMVAGNYASGIYLNGLATFVSENAATNNQHGIYFLNSSGTVQSNNIYGNQYGIYLSNSLANINLNRIIGNSKYGIYNTGNGTVNASNNWWGSNNSPSFSSNNPSDIYNASGIIVCDTWLVLNMAPNPPGTINQSMINSDLTHNNAGNDTSSQGNLPDNIPMTFITNFGTIASPAYTRNGKVSTIFSRGTNTSGIANITATLDYQTVQTNVFFDETPLVIFVNPAGGYYNRTQNVTLITTNPNGNATTYYTTDGSDPKVNGIVYSNPIPINTTITLRYIAFDPAYNWGPEYTRNYIIDTTAPTVTANIMGGIYNTTQTVNLTANDNICPNPVIYYTLDGSDPTTSSSIYSSPITLQMNVLTRTIIDLKFMAVDLAGNNGQIQTETYILTLPIVNVNNKHTYNLIQML